MRHSRRDSKAAQNSWKDLNNKWTDTDYNLNDKFNAPVEEAYKILRTNIQFCGIDRNRTLTITSCNPGEGKTTVAMNLAVMIAKSGVKVLLIDADMRKPQTSKQLGKKDARGLSNILAGYDTFEETVSVTNLENLFFLPSGTKPPNPTELLNGPSFLELLLNVQNDYDVVIYDTPPLGSVIDAAIIGSQTDSTILVIESGAVNQESVLRVKEQLGKTNARILGVVLNKIKKGVYCNYYNYYNYYDYYGSIKPRKGLSRIFHIFSIKEKIAV